jgi:hypothetical protein
MRKIILLFALSGTILAASSLYAEEDDETPPVTTASPRGGSYNSPVTVILTVNETARTYYCTGINCTPSSRYSSPLRFTRTTTLRYYSVRSDRPRERVKSQTYTITGADTTPPVTTATPAGGSFPSAVTVALSSNEPATTYYCLGSSCSPATAYSASLRFSATTTLRYYSRDTAGNSESVKTQTYTITAADTTPPVTTATPAGGSFPGAVTVALSSNEPATTYYCLGSSCSPTTVYSASLQFSATTTLRYYSRDTAGNSEATKSQTYTMQTQSCTPEPVLPQHSNLSWTGSYEVCTGCHADKVSEVLNSTHYQWKGSSAEMVSGAVQQGKIVQMDSAGTILPGTSAMNSYCINILGNWNGCGSCHIGLGAQPTTTGYNVDCLVCHQKNYKRKKVSGLFQPDTANMCISMDTAVQSVHRPTRENCAQCHAYGGGGDNFKRGDLAVAHVSTTDTTFDRHMSTAGGNLRCQSCHVTAQHKIAGRGSDLRPLDLATTVTCTNCHATKAGTSGHTTADVNKHVGRLACQTCHIPTFAKNAADTSASEATEIHRDWQVPEWNAAKLRWEPTPTKANNLIPEYLHWNGTSWGYNLKDAAIWDSKTSAYPMSRPQGGINDANSKLYPFKYKTATQAFAAALNLIIPIDTAKYWAMPAPPSTPSMTDINAAVTSGLTNLGLSPTATISWVMTDEYQLIAHEVPTAANNVLACAKCHINSTATQMKLTAELGYAIKKPTSDLCNDCHGSESYTSNYSGFLSIHSRHVNSQQRDCSNCHNFSRPERGLR